MIYKVWHINRKISQLIKRFISGVQSVMFIWEQVTEQSYSGWMPQLAEPRREIKAFATKEFATEQWCLTPWHFLMWLIDMSLYLWKKRCSKHVQNASLKKRRCDFDCPVSASFNTIVYIKAGIKICLWL